MSKIIKRVLIIIIFLILGISTTSNASKPAKDSFYFYAGQEEKKIEIPLDEGDENDPNIRNRSDANDIGRLSKMIDGIEHYTSASSVALDDFWVFCIKYCSKLRNTQVDKDTLEELEENGTFDRLLKDGIIFEKHLSNVDENDFSTDKDGYLTEGSKGYGNVNNGNRKDFAEKLGFGREWKQYEGNNRYVTKYTNKTEVQSNNRTVQEALYALDYAYRIGNINLGAQLMWGLGLNEGVQTDFGSTLYQEIKSAAVNYGQYYEDKSRNPVDNPLGVENKTNIENVKVIVNQDEKNYLVGPFEISYLYGYSSVGGKRDNFSEITSLKVLNEFNVEMNLIDIVDENGNSIKNRDDYKYPTPNEKFYVKINGNATKIHIDVEFKYTIDYTATLYKYEGTVYAFVWEDYYWKGLEKYGIDNPKHNHTIYSENEIYCGYGYEHEHTYGCYAYTYFYWCDNCDKDASECTCDNPNIHQQIGSKELTCKIEPHTHDRSCHTKNDMECESFTFERVYVEVAWNSEDTQSMLAYGKDSEKHTDNKSLTIAPEGINLPKMKIAGTVFLDKYEGKENEGNNLFDDIENTKKEDKEGLEGVDVWLYNSNGNLVKIALTDSNGHYEFDGLDVFEKYYVEFAYNGMLYTNVTPNVGNDQTIASKVSEDPKIREAFNNKFQEIGSYPNNYGGKNKVYYQEDLIELFKEVSSKIVVHNGDENKAYKEVRNNHSEDSEIESKLQFIKDCRIKVRSVTYPIMPIFTVDEDKNTKNEPIVAPYKEKTVYVRSVYNETFTIFEKGLEPILGENSQPIDQLHVNLGIKARPTFDLALYNDVYKAEVKINGKTQTYVYDDRKAWTGAYANGFPIGVSEEDYLSSVRAKYIEGSNFSIGKRERDQETDTYTLEMRTEEIKNGIMTESRENYASSYKDVSNDNNKKLKIFVTYRISLKNQSGINGAVTEVVDYYDKNYTFVSAYLEDANGNKTTVAKNDTSKYEESTQYKNNDKYQTIYLQPDKEITLNNNNQNAYIYVTLELKNANQDAGTILSEKILNGDKYNTINLAEINGYKTTKTDILNKEGKIIDTVWGIVDKDSNPGNFDMTDIKEFTDDELKSTKGDVNNDGKLTNEDIEIMKEILAGYDKPKDAKYDVNGDGEFNSKDVVAVLKQMNESKLKYEDDTSKAPAFVYSLRESRTLEGTVFEDTTTVNAETGRLGDGILDNNEQGVEGVRVELWEEGNDTPVAVALTNENGHYGFIGYLPGDYRVKYTYGSKEDETINASFNKYGYGKYNGQDFESIYKEKTSNVYWYKDDKDTRLSDARDDTERRDAVRDYLNAIKNGEYINGAYDVQITNHKAEVFNSIYDKNSNLLEELKDNTWKKAYTDKMSIDMEYESMEMAGNKNTNIEYEVKYNTKYDEKYDINNDGKLDEDDALTVKKYLAGYNINIDRKKADVNGDNKVDSKDAIYLAKKINELQELKIEKKVIDENKSREDVYAHKVTNVDFGIVERAHEKLKIEKTVSNLKLTLTDGTVLFDANGETANLQWAEKKIVAIMDEEQINGAKLEITYNIKVSNLSEANTGKTQIKTIVDYVANNLNFDTANNLDQNQKSLWEVVKISDIQKDDNSSLVNKKIDLSTRTTTIKAAEENPLLQVLKPGDSADTSLVLTKVLSTENVDDLSYENTVEIVEYANDIGRYDRESIPGNLVPDKDPEQLPKNFANGLAGKIEEDSAKAKQPITILPSFGQTMIYYTLAGVVLVMLGVGIFLIKKKVVDKK